MEHDKVTYKVGDKITVRTLDHPEGVNCLIVDINGDYVKVHFKYPEV